MNNRPAKHSFNLVFTVLLLGIFAMAAVFVAVLGARVYANSAQKMQDNFDTRTSLVYLSEKIRTSEGAGSVSVKPLDGAGDALVIAQELNGARYESWIYIYEGNLMESPLVAEGSPVIPQAGQEIMPLRSFTAEVKDGGVWLSVETEPAAEDGTGQTARTFISGRTDV